VSVVTNPATSTVVSDGTGHFALADIPIGAYALIGSKTGYQTTTLSAVGVAGGGTTQVTLSLSVAEPAGPATVSGLVKGVSGKAVASATVSVEGQTASTTTAADGTFTLTGVEPGQVFLKVTGTGGFLDGGNRKSIKVPEGGSLSNIAITLSGRPSAAAEYVGENGCKGCHAAYANELHKAGHYHFVTPGVARVVNANMWPAVGQTLNPAVTALDPVDGTTMVPVYLCQPAAGAYSMKFAGTPDCAVNDGTFVPVSATIGGEGDGGVDNAPNFGVYKQRYLAKIADVPYALTNWTVPYKTTQDRDRDYLILPVYMVQDGNTDPVFGAISPKFFKIYPDKWLKQLRATSRLCSACHNTGLKITYSGADFLVDSYSYQDVNITCERCHGPGSEHISPPSGVHMKDAIIQPRVLSARAAQESCGQCHAAHSGSSKVPLGQFKYPFNGDHLADLGNGVFVPGLYELSDFIKGFNTPLAQGGGVEMWPDNFHTKAHSQQYPNLVASKHNNNMYERLACFDCHDAHSTYYGPAKHKMVSGTDTYELKNPRLKDNTLCLSCHAGMGPFAALLKADVAALHSTNGQVKKNGTVTTFDAAQVTQSKTVIAQAISSHMQATSAMGVAAYTPLNDKNPVGRCSACHMPKIGKKNDVSDVTQWHLGWDADDKSALVEGNVASHTWDVIWPYQSALLKKASGGTDLDIMPNSCGKCHRGARLSGD
jgi:hypothetical protein